MTFYSKFTIVNILPCITTHMYLWKLAALKRRQSEFPVNDRGLFMCQASISRPRMDLILDITDSIQNVMCWLMVLHIPVCMMFLTLRFQKLVKRC